MRYYLVDITRVSTYRTFAEDEEDARQAALYGEGEEIASETTDDTVTRDTDQTTPLGTLATEPADTPAPTADTQPAMTQGEIDRLAAAVRQAHPTTPIPDDLLLLLTQVAQDAADLVSCNCSYTASHPSERCDGTCTHGMATRALAALQAYQTGGAQ